MNTFNGLELLVGRQRWRWIGSRDCPSTTRKVSARYERWEAFCSCGDHVVRATPELSAQLNDQWMRNRSQGLVTLTVRDNEMPQLEVAPVCKRCARQAEAQAA